MQVNHPKYGKCRVTPKGEDIGDGDRLHIVTLPDGREYDFVVHLRQFEKGFIPMNAKRWDV